MSLPVQTASSPTNNAPSSRDGTPLSNNWQDGCTISFTFRNQLMIRIEQVDGNTLILRDAPPRSVTDAVIRHDDQTALQAAVDQAIQEQKNLFLPSGHYRLSGPILVTGADALTIEGQGAVGTVLDISNGAGACLSLETSRFILQQPHLIKSGAFFEIYPPEANWTVHDSTITGCLHPVLLDAYGSVTSFFYNNLVTRGSVEEARTAVDICGQFILTGNRISGFDENGRISVSQKSGVDPSPEICDYNCFYCGGGERLACYPCHR